MITSYFPSENSATIAYTNFKPSVRCASHGDNANTAFGVVFVNAPSFNTSIISPSDSRISFLAGHTASSANLGSRSLQETPTMQVIIYASEHFWFISLCRWTPIALDTDCITSRLVAASALSRQTKTRTRNYAQSPSLQLPISWLSSFQPCSTPRRWSRPSQISARHICRSHLVGLLVSDKPFLLHEMELLALV